MNFNRIPNPTLEQEKADKMNKKFMGKNFPRIALFFLLATMAAAPAKAGILYEGWHKVLSAGQHVGYFVVRYDLDKKTNKFTYTSFLKTNAVGNDVTEAVKAESLQVTKPALWIVPQKYQYTSTEGKKVTLIDAAFHIEGGSGAKGKKKAKLHMIAKITKDGKSTTYDQILPDDTFLSGYLTYIILQSKEGLKVGNNYKYAAIAEEDAKLYNGTAFVKERTHEAGQDGYKIIDEFKGIRFISIVNAKGDPLATKSPLLSIATQAAATREEAVGNLKLDEKNIRTLFGNIPSAGAQK
jgi:hypothetical protein